MFKNIAHLLNLQKDRRGHPRLYDPPLKLTIEKKEYLTDDWSMSGCRISNYLGDYSEDDHVEVYQLNPPGRLKYFSAEVVWRAPDNSVGLRFLKIEDLYSATGISG